MTVIAATAGRAVHRPAGTGPAYWGPGDHYTFLVTGEESAGSTFAMEALVPPGGGPPPHVHRQEDETFYVLDGELEFLLGEELVTGRTGDVVFVPRGTVHRFRNADTGNGAPAARVHPRRDGTLLRGDPRARAERGDRAAGQRRRGRGPLRRGGTSPRARVRVTVPWAGRGRPRPAGTSVTRIDRRRAATAVSGVRC